MLLYGVCFFFFFSGIMRKNVLGQFGGAAVRGFGGTPAQVPRCRLRGDRHRALGSDCSLCPLDGRRRPRASRPLGPVQCAGPCVPQLNNPGLERKDRGVESLAWPPFLGPPVPHIA